jgi:hypothetical protein
MPNGFVLEQVTGNWETRVVHGTRKMNRCSLSKGQLLRYSRIKRGAVKLCEKLKIPEPLTIRTIAYRDAGTSGQHFALLRTLEDQISVERVQRVSDQFAKEPPSPDELRRFVAITYGFMWASFVEWRDTALQQRGRTEERDIGAWYSYVNCLKTQTKMNPQVAAECVLDKKEADLEDLVLNAHSQICRRSS